MRATLGLLFLACAMLFAGCGEDGGTRRAVQGTIKLQGSPLDQGTISFYQEPGPPTPTAGAMIQNGAYKIPAPQGLDPGKYRVVISSPEPSPPISPEDYAAGKMPTTAKERIPAAYNTESKEMVEVKASGVNEFNFDVK